MWFEHISQNCNEIFFFHQQNVPNFKNPGSSHLEINLKILCLIISNLKVLIVSIKHITITQSITHC